MFDNRAQLSRIDSDSPTLDFPMCAFPPTFVVLDLFSAMSSFYLIMSIVPLARLSTSLLAEDSSQRQYIDCIYQDRFVVWRVYCLSQFTLYGPLRT